MLWTGRVRAINSGGVGRVKERERDKTHVGGQFVEARGARAITFPKPLALSRDRVTGTTIHRFAPYNPRVNLQPRPPSPVSSRARLVPPDPLRRPNNPIRLFPTRMCTYTKVCNFGVENARYRINDRCIVFINVRALTKERKNNNFFEKSVRHKTENRRLKECFVEICLKIISLQKENAGTT